MTMAVETRHEAKVVQLVGIDTPIKVLTRVPKVATHTLSLKQGQEHVATHPPFRSWCEDCVASKVDEQHRQPRTRETELARWNSPSRK